MKATSQSSLLVSPIAILSDGSNSMASGIVGRDLQIGTNNSLTKYVLHSLCVPLIKSYPLDQRQRILCIGKVGWLRSEAIERHACDTSGPLLVERVCDFRGSLIIVNDNVKKTVAANDLHGCAVAFVDFVQPSKRPLH